LNLERQRKDECQNADCKLDKTRCLVRYGSCRIRAGGTKIPVQCLPDERRSFQAQTTAMKGYWIVDGRADDRDEWG
jgi:hypothetical protein